LERGDHVALRVGPDRASRETGRAYLRLLLGMFPGRALLVLALMVAVVVVEWLGLLLLAPLLELAGVGLGDGTASRMAEGTADALAALGLAPTLVVVLLIYATVVAGRAALQRLQSITMVDLESRFTRSLRRRLFHAILRARWSVVSRQRSSDLLHALTSQVGRVGQATDHLLPLAAQILVVAVYLLFAFLVSPLITLLVLGAGLGLVLLLWRETTLAYATGERMTAATGALYGAIVEQINGLKTARSYRAEERTEALFDARQQEVVCAQLHAQRNFSRARLTAEVGAVLVLGLMLYVAVEVATLAVAEVLLLIYLFGRVVPRLSGLQQSYQYFVNALPAFGDVIRLMEVCEAESEPHVAGARDAIPLKHGIRMSGVTFSYRPETGRPAVLDLDLRIPAHLTTAIVGPSGSGKTTIADLVLGLIRPERGQVLVDDIVLGPDTIGPWRDRIGYVSQDSFLFHDTIRANLLWARPDATEDDLREALRLAAAEIFVRRLAAGLDTVVGDRGILLSGGERQRLALARALLRRPELLILDEATSSLDSENERQIQRAIERLHGHTTILVITHRLSTIREADVIHVVEDGRLVESGSWRDLVRRGGRFEDLCRAQRIDTGHHSHRPAALAAAGS
jgi:ATP-binding cassette, subfamily C, bacterial